jgi:hypothetical protein
MMAVVLLCATRLRAEIWCGQSRLAPLDHPCAPAPRVAVSRAVLKYRNDWMALKGVLSVDSAESEEGDGEIWVRVAPDFTNPNESLIPASAGGIPVVILPGDTTIGAFGSDFLPLGPGNHKAEDCGKSEWSYSAAVKKYRERWLAVPGVVGIRPVKFDHEICEFGAVGITVQRQLLGLARKQIPNDVDGVPVVLISQD